MHNQTWNIGKLIPHIQFLQLNNSSQLQFIQKFRGRGQLHICIEKQKSQVDLEHSALNV